MLARNTTAVDADREWLQLRETILRRDGYRCRNCSSGNHLEVHHWRPLPEDSAGISRSGYRINADDYRIVPASGLVTLCKICHSALTGARAVVRLAEGASYRTLPRQQNEEWLSIFKLWKLNGRSLPLKVIRKSWNQEIDHFWLVERIELRRWPFASVWGRYHRNGIANEQAKIRSARSYEWKPLDMTAGSDAAKH